MKIIEDKKIPRALKDSKSWELSRRHFLQSAMALGAFSQMSLLQSCIISDEDDSIVSKKQLEIVTVVQNILFSKDEQGPGANDFNADKYLLWVLQDERLDPSENEYLINGISWIDESAEETYQKSFLKLSKKEQVLLVQKVAQSSWGESWLSMLLTFILEAMISDPIYGFNTDGVGWKWLKHQVGVPRPTKELIYDSIFKTVEKNVQDNH